MLDTDLSFHYYSKVPKRHGRFEPLVDSTSEQWSKWYEAMKSRMMYGGLYGFIGKRGTGKTQLAVSLVGYSHYKENRRGMYFKSADLFEELRSGNNVKQLMRKLVEIPVLVIDAIEVRKDSDYEHRELNRIVDKRYDAFGKITILISNDTQEAFERFVGASVISRMNETGGIFPFDGKSFREDK